jgi:hypothetical protein
VIKKSLGSRRSRDGHNLPVTKRITIFKFRVAIKLDEDGVFVAEVPTLPGCLSQGRTRAEAIANIREAIAA